MLAYITPRPQQGQDEFLKQCLLTGGNSMRRQNQLPFAEQGDTSQVFDPAFQPRENSDYDGQPKKRGWGLAWFKSAGSGGKTTMRVEKSVVPAWRDPQYESTARKASGENPQVLLAHLRDQTFKGEKEECHPFRIGDLALMHHGDLSSTLVSGLNEELAALERQGVCVPPSRTRGNKSDTELIARFLAARLLQKRGSLDTSTMPPEELKRFFQDVVNELTHWPTASTDAELRKHREQYPTNRKTTHPGNLNLVFSNGRQLLATRYAPGCSLHLGVHRDSQGKLECLVATDPVQLTTDSGIESVQWRELGNKTLFSAYQAEDDKGQPMIVRNEEPLESSPNFAAKSWWQAQSLWSRCRQKITTCFQSIGKAFANFFNWLGRSFHKKQA